MRIFVSSSFEDLREHRAAAIRVLRQLGHEVIAMEEMVAGTAPPLAKVIEMVDRSEAYVGIFAWRYGYVPEPAAGSRTVRGRPAAAPGAADGRKSMTHLEFDQAVKRKLPVMVFLLDEQWPWPPQWVDGFDHTAPRSTANAEKIRGLRRELQKQRVVSRFTSPSDLESRVAAAVTMCGVTRQLDLLPAAALPAGTGVAGDSSARLGITQAIRAAGDRQTALKIDLVSTWWSTRLFLTAALAERVTKVRRILVVETRLTPHAAAPDEPPRSEERFVGQLSTCAILETIGPKVPALVRYAESLRGRLSSFSTVEVEMQQLLDLWSSAFQGASKRSADEIEREAKTNLTPELLRRWFGDAMLQQPVHIADLQRASVVDLLRLLDYPNDFVPVLTRHAVSAPGGPAPERVDVMDKVALNARLARSYLVELMDRARIV